MAFCGEEVVLYGDSAALALLAAPQDLAWHPPAVSAGWDQTLDLCSQTPGSSWASVAGCVELESHENHVGTQWAQAEALV